MNTAMISSDHQVVIPADLRRAPGFQPGRKVQIIQYDNRVELIPLRPIQKARGTLKGIDTTVEREGDRA